MAGGTDRPSAWARPYERKLREQGVSREAIQSAVRIAAVIHAAACVHEYEGSGNRYLDRAA